MEEKPTMENYLRELTNKLPQSSTNTPWLTKEEYFRLELAKVYAKETGLSPVTIEGIKRDVKELLS